MSVAIRKQDAVETEESTTWAAVHLEEWRLAKYRRQKRTNVESDSSWILSYADLMTLLVGFFALLLSVSTVESREFEKIKQSVAEKMGGAYEKPYASLATDFEKAVASSGLADMVLVETDEQGVTITFRDSVFFDLGSSEIKPAARDILDKLISATQAQTQDFNVVVEGHTDSVPLRSKDFTNWELSGLRAARVVRAFVDYGFDPARLQGVGFGDTRPLNKPEGEPDSLAVQAKNRRVVIRLIKSFVKQGS